MNKSWKNNNTLLREAKTIRDYYDNFEMEHQGTSHLYGKTIKELLYQHPLYEEVFDKAKNLGYKPRCTVFKGWVCDEAMSITAPSLKFPEDLDEFIRKLGLVHKGRKRKGQAGYIFKFCLFEKDRWPEPEKTTE